MTTAYHKSLPSIAKLATIGLALFAVLNFAPQVHAQTFEKLYDIPDSPQELRHPIGGFSQAPDGTLYAESYGSLPNQRMEGSLFSFVPGSDPVVLKDFISDYPMPDQGRAGGPILGSNVVADSDGNVYGTLNPQNVNDKTYVDSGTIYRFGPDGYTVIHKFGGLIGKSTNPEGIEPRSRLLLATDGNIYGLTEGGGATENGVIYRLKLNGDYKALYSFHTPELPGYATDGGLSEAADGSLYGIISTAYESAVSGYVYRLKPDAASSRGFDLSLVATTPVEMRPVRAKRGYGGDVETAPLVVDGQIFGTYGGYGGQGQGSLWKIDTHGHFRFLAGFFDSSVGLPGGAIVRTPDGNIWITAYGKSNPHNFGFGAIYEFSVSGSLLWRYYFGNDFTGQDGYHPNAALFLAADGNLYGTTEWGGAYNEGTIYEIVDP